MNAREHFEEAERLLSEASFRKEFDKTPVYRDGKSMRWEENRSMVSRAKVHALLALAAANGALLPELEDLLPPAVD